MEPSKPEEIREEVREEPREEVCEEQSAAAAKPAHSEDNPLFSHHYIARMVERKHKRRVYSMVGTLIKVVALLLVGALIALLIVPNAWTPRLSGMSSTDKIDLLQEMIRAYYIAGNDIDREAMGDALAAAYVYGLGDPYSAYFTKEQLQQVLSDNRGDFSGIGVSVTYAPDPESVFVYRVYKDSPAAAVGILPGDRITAIDGIEVTVANYNERVSAIQGQAGTQVALRIVRGDSTLNMSVTRAAFVIESVFSRVVGNVGVIEVTEFNQATDDQFREAVRSLQQQGVAALIVDMRGNHGGLMDIATNMLDLLLPYGELGYAVYSDNKRESLGTSDSSAVDLPFAVLVDKDTASAAEFFTAVMRDSGNAVIVGETTYGKGIMQTTYPLGDGTAVRLTVAKFYSMSGTEFHEIGLKPDVEATLPDGVNRRVTPDEDTVLQAALAALGK